MVTRSIRLACVLCVLMAACGDEFTPTDGGAARDASLPMDAGDTDAGDADAGPPPGPVAPDIPWLALGQPEIAEPALTPCPVGWSEVDYLGYAVCEPWPAGGTRDCDPGQAHFPGEAGCVPVGDACPSGDFADGLPADRPVVYVLEGAGGLGDGSMAMPFASIEQAVASGLADDTILALGPGSYVGGVDLPAGGALWGRCASSTVLEAPSTGATLSLFTGRAQIRNVNLTGTLTADGEGTELELIGVELSGIDCVGVEVSGGASLQADELYVHHMARCVSNPLSEVGVLVRDGAVAQIRRAVFLDSAGVAVTVTSSADDTSLTMEDVLVHGMTGEATPPWIDDGLALLVDDTSPPETDVSVTATVRRALFEESFSSAVLARGSGGAATLEDTTVRAHGSPWDIWAGGSPPLVADMGGRIDARRLVLRETVSTNPAILGGFDSVLTLSDAVVAQNKGGGIDLSFADAELRRTAVVRNDALDITIFPAGNILLEDVRLGWSATPTTPRTLDGVVLSEGMGLIALGLAGPTNVTLRRVLLEETRQAGLVFVGSFLEATLEDVVVRRPLQVGTSLGRGIELWDSAHVTGQRVLLTDFPEVGISARGGVLEITDTVIRRGTGSLPGGLLGRGLAAVGSDITASRVLIEDTRDLAVTAHGSLLSMEDLRVSDTDRRACAASGDCDEFGHALGLYESAATITRFEVTQTATCGVHLANASEVDLSKGVVSNAVIGVCLQIEDYDIRRLQDDVIYRDNDLNLDATELPLPATTPELP